MRVVYRYWNTNGIGICVAAHEGGAHDVSAYIGASAEGAESTEYAIEHTFSWGAKLTQVEAFRFLPELEDLMFVEGLYYRD